MTGRPARRWLLALTACAGAMVAAPPLFAQAGSVEYAVKATYLYKFAPFVEWPAGTFASPADPFVVCVVGRDAVADLADDAVGGQKIGSHGIVVRHMAAGNGDELCHIAYVALRGRSAAAALARLRGKPVLTVTDAAREAAERGIVNFAVRDNRVRFEIDQNAAAESRLVISSKLLNLALRAQ
ncbi:MAG TPA: YfiR family protein [Casimicrobiaceae bacterium]|nr:YfiR family protein [Casimicrobiaceae bacterium]